MYDEAGKLAKSASTNLREYLSKEDNKTALLRDVARQVEQSLSLTSSKTKLIDFAKEKDNFLKLLGKTNEDYESHRRKLGDFNYGKRLPGTEKTELRPVTPLPNGNGFYFGEWLLDFDVLQGKGMLIDKQGFLFEGWFINNQIVSGRYIWSNLYTYTGSFFDFKAQGRGAAYYRNGTRYIGDWKQGSFHGQGTYHYYNGESWQGEWVQGVPVGLGVLTGRDGRTTPGAFKGFQK
jgi:hypothetical protein